MEQFLSVILPVILISCAVLLIFLIFACIFYTVKNIIIWYRDKENKKKHERIMNEFFTSNYLSKEYSEDTFIGKKMNLPEENEDV